MTASVDAHSDIPTRLAAVRARIAKAARDAGHDPASVVLVAVAKTHPAEQILPAIEAGHRVFGENRVQEAAAKWPALRTQHPDIQLHLIGPLQTNKVKEAVALFDVIETVDREKLARALAVEMDRQGKRPEVYLQVKAENEAAARSAAELASGVLRDRSGEGR